MRRLIIEKLLKWKASKRRKPLILQGARQVGKTWILKEFGRLHYQNVAYFSFEDNPEYKQFFENTKDFKRISQNLAMASGQKITPKDTLLIFDEIQNCPNALNTLKYIYENANEFHVACAGSLLGVALAKSAAFPVGMVDFLPIYPMNFTEFLLANECENLVEYMNSISKIEPVPEAFFNPLCEKLKMYHITGGMPEAVKIWAEEKDVEGVQTVLSSILKAYTQDFAKHPSVSDIPKISLVWQSISSQLSRENKKFLYRAIKDGARAREYENALQWLTDAGLLYKIYRCSEPNLPISAYDDLSAFKLYMLDVGLLRRQAMLAPSVFAEGNRLFTEFKGALAENYVLQALRPQFEAMPRYWAVDNPRYEVDFLIQHENDIFPIEVKAETNIESKSLKHYKAIFEKQTKLRIRFSLKNLCLNNDMLNVPLFLADYTKRLVLLPT